MWIASRERSQELDRKAVEAGISNAALMESAGRASFEALEELLPPPGRISVLCGKGHNGGDALIVARLAIEAGYDIDCILACTRAELAPATLEQLEIAEARGVQPVFSDEKRWHRKLEMLGCRDLIVDGLLGTGARNAVCGPVLEAIEVVNRSGVPVLAIDVPSGIDCDTGEELGESVWAVRTVTFGLPKPFLFQSTGLEHSGYWTVADIGYPEQLLEEPTEARLTDCVWVGSLLPERRRSSHKGENGSVLIVGGSARMRGAAVLAAKSAVRSGAGLVTVAGISCVCDAVASQVPEALLMPLPETSGAISTDAAYQVIDAQSRHDSGLFGPGLTHDAPILEFLRRVWANWEKPALIDADALNAVSKGVPLPKVDCVLTPHPGEMSRLMEQSIAECQADRFSTVASAVARYHQCILLKGPYSIIGEPGQPMLVNATGNPGMASGGMGDVLSGVIATLLAQDLPGYYAASCGAYWHGTAGDLCAEEIGPVGYSALDVANRLPQARAKLTASCDAC